MKRTLILAVLLALPAFAAQKDDDFRAAQAAANANKIEEAARLFCAIAKADPAFHNGEAAQDCKIYQDQVNRENARNEERYTDGVNFFNQGLLDNAEQKFRAIHSGPHLADAQNYLSSKIPAAKQQAAAQGAESAMSAKFEQAKEAFNNNAFTSAKSGFSQVASGSHQSEAQAYLQKIQQYEQFMQQGDSAAAGKNYQAAMSAYQNAANIKGDGPGDPNGKLSSVRMMASANAPQPQQQQQPQQIQPPPPRPVVSAVVAPTRKVDIQALLRKAQAAQRKRDYGSARGAYLAVLSEDSSNEQAHAGLDALPKDTVATGTEADVLLAKGIAEYYGGDFAKAEVHIGDYISNQGGKSALAYFYLATSKLTRYFLGGDNEKKLLAEAKEDFKKAKISSAFKPPEKMVSPKILKIFEETS